MAVYYKRKERGVFAKKALSQPDVCRVLMLIWYKSKRDWRLPISFIQFFLLLRLTYLISFTSTPLWAFASQVK